MARIQSASKNQKKDFKPNEEISTVDLEDDIDAALDIEDEDEEDTESELNDELD